MKIVLLVEDDFLNRRLSKKVLSENGYAVLEAKNAKEALETMKKEPIALAILDINLGEDEQDGIMLGQQLKDNYAIPFIYLTSYDNAEVIDRAISTSPYSYLTKPFKKSDLIASVEIAIRQSVGKHIPKISVKDGDYMISLPVDRINYIESAGNYLLFHTDNNSYKSRCTITQVLDTLPESVFVRVHRAYVVNRTKIEKHRITSVIVRDTEIPVSKNYMGNI